MKAPHMRKCMDFADIRSVGQAVGFVSDWSCLYIYIYIFVLLLARVLF